MADVSTHVLDTSRGRPAVGVAVALTALDGTAVASATTDRDGRVGSLAADLPVGVYRLTFDVAAYQDEFGERAFYPEVVVTFRIEAAEHHHIPLLLSRFGYSTYRGS